MAGFFLVSKDEKNLYVEKALKAFLDFGLQKPSVYQLDKYILYLYNKATAKEPYICKTTYGFCAAVGAYIYKGLNYHQSLERTIDDIIHNTLSFSDMYGQYTLIIYIKDKIYMLADALSAKHFFSDKSYSFFSSSFFAAAAAVGDISINDMAIYEKMLTGIIISPDTLVNEIIQMNKEEQKKANSAECGVHFLIHPNFSILPEHKQGRKRSISEQADKIKTYFTVIKPALEEERVDLGLSAGHDSSLIFAAIASTYNNIHIHTHSTGHVHDREKNAAVNMAKTKGIEATIIPTPRLDEAGIDLHTLLQENLLFFDGRTSHDIGGFSATYRAEYRMLATDGCLTTLTGVGGECLRNHYSVRGNIIDADRFFEDKAFNRSFMEAAPPALIEKVKQYHIDKAEKVLRTKLHGKTDRLSLRRYYSEILMADGQGNVVDAYNTVSKCIAPFLDPHLLKEAYRGIRYLGNCGEYESEVICALDPQIGSCINANNGYPFDRIPIKLRIKEALRALVSSEIWEKLNQIKKGKSKGQNNSYFQSVLNKSIELSVAYKEIEQMYPDINFDVVVQGYAMDALVEYLALTMRKIKNEI